MSKKKGNRYDMQTVLAAIKGSGSIMSTIARRLDCDWSTARAYVNKWEETKDAYEDEEQTILDMAESKLYESIQLGNTQDAKWLLSTKGKRRGFNEKHEIQHSGDIDSTIRIEVVSADS